MQSNIYNFRPEKYYIEDHTHKLETFSLL